MNEDKCWNTVKTEQSPDEKTINDTNRTRAHSTSWSRTFPTFSYQKWKLRYQCSVIGHIDQRLCCCQKYLTSLKITTISADVPLCADVAVFIIFVSLCVLKYESTKATTVISSGVQPYWIGDLDTIIMKNPELYTSHGGFHENRKSLSQQLEPSYTTQVFVFTVWDGLIRYW